MVVNISEAARIASKTRRTIYKHINQGKLSSSRDSKGNRGVDLTELIRVYGSDVKPPGNVGGEDGIHKEYASVSNSEKMDLLLKKIESLEVEVKSLREEISSQKLIEHKPGLVKPTQSMKEEATKENNSHSSYIERMKKNLADRNKSNNK